MSPDPSCLGFPARSSAGRGPGRGRASLRITPSIAAGKDLGRVWEGLGKALLPAFPYSQVGKAEGAEPSGLPRSMRSNRNSSGSSQGFGSGLRKQPAQSANLSPLGETLRYMVGPNAPSRGARRDIYPVPATPAPWFKVGG